MRFDTLAFALVVLFPVGEVALALGRRARAGDTRRADGGTLGTLWLAILLCLGVAAAGMRVPGARLPGPREPLLAAATLLLAGGLALRWVAIITLGRLFTVDVAVHRDHALVDGGVYRHLRHPSYTGILLAFAGLGLYIGNWLAVGALTLPLWAAFLRRIRQEEAALLAGLGEPYAAYCRRTRRLLPGLW